MAVPPSQTRACNGALILLGESSRITSINDGTPLAKTFLGVWDQAVEELLADHPWNIAVTRANCAVSADYTPQGSQYDKAFELPSDCVRWLPHSQSHPDYFEGEEEDGYILSNADAPICIRYIKLVPDISKWKPGMRAALEAKLAFKTAKPITGQRSMMEAMADVYTDALGKAKRQDGSATGDRNRKAQFRSDWLAARNQRWTGLR